MLIELTKLRYFFFFNDTATPEIYLLSLPDALPISHAAASAAGAEPRLQPRGQGAVIGCHRAACNRHGRLRPPPRFSIGWESSPRPADAGTDLSPQRSHGGGRRVRPPVRMEVDRHRDRVRECARTGWLRGRADLAAPRAQCHAQPRLERALSAGELQHRAQSLGHSTRVR